MDISSLAGDVQSLYWLGISPATHKTYGAALKKFQAFCNQYNILSPFPLSQDTLCSFAADLNRQNISQASLKVYLSALRFYQVGLGLPEPHHTAMPKLKTISNGMKRWRKVVGSLKTKNRLPITPVILAGIKQQWAHRASEYDFIMYWAVACMAFFGFFRLGEIILPSEEHYNPRLHLSAGYVRLDNTANPSVIQIHLKRSKNRPVRTWDNGLHRLIWIYALLQLSWWLEVRRQVHFS